MSLEVAEAVRKSQLDSIVINTTYKLAPWASMLYAADAAWWFFHAQEALKFEGLKVTQADSVPFKAVNCLKSTGVSGFDSDSSCIRTGMNSAYQAVHIAVHAGARKVVLCGVDMTGINWHGGHPKPLRTSQEASYKKMLGHWETLVPELEKRNVEVVNCSDISALKIFKRAKLEDALDVK